METTIQDRIKRKTTQQSIRFTQVSIQTTTKDVINTQGIGDGECRMINWTGERMGVRDKPGR